VTYEYIDTEDKFVAFVDSLKTHGTQCVAFDIEGESNLHQYGETLCLIQVYDGHHAVLIDPFRVPIRPIQEFLENRSILKIMFDAAGDRAFLYKNCGIDPLSILDLQAAAILLDYEKRDLSSVLKQALGLDSGRSKKRFQKYNWCTRPIDPKAIDYALGDVIHLFDLKEQLLADIVGNSLLDQFILKNTQSQNKPHIYDKRPSLFRSSKYKALSGPEQRVFKVLFDLRDRVAKHVNLPPNTVLLNDSLAQLASKRVGLHRVKFDRRVPEAIRNQLILDMKELLE
jgi:ribonuclease D